MYYSILTGNPRGVLILRTVKTIKRCREVLTQNGKQYTDEEIKEIRAFLYRLAEIESNNFKNNAP